MLSWVFFHKPYHSIHIQNPFRKKGIFCFMVARIIELGIGTNLSAWQEASPPRLIKKSKYGEIVDQFKSAPLLFKPVTTRAVRNNKISSLLFDCFILNYFNDLNINLPMDQKFLLPIQLFVQAMELKKGIDSIVNRNSMSLTR